MKEGFITEEHLNKRYEASGKKIKKLKAALLLAFLHLVMITATEQEQNCLEVTAYGSLNVIKLHVLSGWHSAKYRNHYCLGRSLFCHFLSFLQGDSDAQALHGVQFHQVGALTDTAVCMK